MTDEDIEKFQTELKLLFDFYRNKDSGEKIKKISQNYNEVSVDTIKVINNLTDSELKLEERNGTVNMCRGLDELQEMAKAEGIQEGEAKGKKENEIKSIKTMNKNGADIETISRLLDLDIGYVKEVLNS